jgi:hypothetical protein
MDSRKTPSVAREPSRSSPKEISMCWEFDELYRKAREEEARRRKQLEERRDKSPAPAQPAPEAKPTEPVPA